MSIYHISYWDQVYSEILDQLQCVHKLSPYKSHRKASYIRVHKIPLENKIR